MMVSEGTRKVLASAYALSRETGRSINDVLLFSALCMADTPVKEFIENYVDDINTVYTSLGIGTIVNVPDEGVDELSQASMSRLAIDARRILKYADDVAIQTGFRCSEPMHILYVITTRRVSTHQAIVNALAGQGADIRRLNAAVLDEIRSMADESDDSSSDSGFAGPDNRSPVRPRNAAGRRTGGKSGKHKTLEQFGKNLTEKAKKGEIDPVIGREEEINRVMQILVRRTKTTLVS